MRIKQLLADYRLNKTATAPERMVFTGFDDFDVYNITAPIQIADKKVIFGRVEKRDSEMSRVVAFENIEGRYNPIKDFSPLDLQDPFVTFIEGNLILGGVEVFPKAENSQELSWKTVFYKGNRLNDLHLFFKGPIGMKDIRLKELPDHRILVLTRPQGDVGGRGKIGATIINSLAELSIDLIEQAPLLSGQFTDEEWGGANDMYVLDDETVVVLGHIANFDSQGNRHYYPITFQLNINTLTILDAKIIAERSDFLPGPSKRPDLEDVIFSGGLLEEDGVMRLYVGVSDADAQVIQIEPPF